MIQQKLELQGKVDNMNSALEQEKKTHQAVKDQLKKREEELKKECAEIEAKLVSMLESIRLLFCEPTCGFFQGSKGLAISFTLQWFLNDKVRNFWGI